MSLSAEERLRNIFTLLNLSSTYDPRNGIPKSTYDAVHAELDDVRAEGWAAAREQVNKHQCSASCNPESTIGGSCAKVIFCALERPK